MHVHKLVKYSHYGNILYSSVFHSRDSSVGVVATLRAGRSGF
jgi:hypothetical protein